MDQIKQARLEINNQNDHLSKQTTLFSLNSIKSEDSQTSYRGNKSKFAPQSAQKPSAFKQTLITKNSFDSDNSQDDIQPHIEQPTHGRNLLRRARAFESVDEEDDDIGSQQTQQTQQQQRHPKLSPTNFSQIKSINSIAMMIVSKKNWFNVQNKDMLLGDRSARSSLARDQLSQTILSLNLKCPVFSFCTHRIGRFQNWKVRYVDYYQQNKCFQINFLGLDNLFYKMFIPVKSQKEFNHSQKRFVTIWPIVLEYLMEYMQSKKIILKFTDDVNQDKKYVITDCGLANYFQENKKETEVTQLISRVINYKSPSQNMDGNDSDESFESRISGEDSEDEDDDYDEDGTPKKKKVNPYKFFLGLARKNSYFPTIRDAKAASKIKKIFEILLYRYMYDQLRPTGKKLILKKDASTQKYKTLSKKIQKLENDLEKTTMKQQIKQVTKGNAVDNLLSQKFGMFQLRKLVQKDLMKIPDKQEYQIEQIWRLRYRENAYQLSSFILKTKENYFYLVSISLAFKKDHNALLQMFLKKNDQNKGLKDQFDKIIQVQLLRKPKQQKNIEEQIKERQQKEQKILQMIEQQQMAESPHHQRSIMKRNSLTKLSTYGSSSRLQSQQNIPVSGSETKQKINNQKIFQEDDFKEILAHFDLNQIIRGIVYTQKIPKNFKHLCIKNLKRRVIITDEQLFLRLDKIDIISRKINQPPPILVQTEVPDASDPRMRDFLTKQNPFNQIFGSAYQKSEFRQEKQNTKQHNFDQDSELSDDNEPDFTAYYGHNHQIKEVQEDFEKIEKAEKANNYYFEELHFKCSCNMKQSNNSIYLKYICSQNTFYLKVTMHGQDHTESDHLTENIHAHLDITVICPKLRFRKTYSTSKRKALLLFNSFKKIKYKNAFDPPIFLTTRKRIELDFETNIQRVSRRKTLGEIMQRTEVQISNLSVLPAIEILKISLLKNSSQMESLRSFKRFSVVDSINSFGKVVVTMTIFYDQVSGKLYSLEFQDFTSKSRLYRIALNDNDLQDLFGLRLFADDSADTIIRIIRRICYHVRFEQQNFYRVPFLYFREEQYRNGLQLDKRNIIDKLRKNEFYSNYRRFYNKIVKNTFEKENLNKNKKVYLIDAQRKQSRIIFHKAFVHQNEYFIMTINKSLVLQEFWMLSIYVPKTGRRIMGYIQSRDIEQIQFQNLNKDMGLFELYDRDQPFKSYYDFMVAVQNVVVKQSPRTNQRAKNSFLRAYTKKFSHKLQGQNSINLDKSMNDSNMSPPSPDYVKMDHERSGDHLDLPSEDEPVKPIISPRITPRMMMETPKVIIPQKVIQRHEKRYGTHIHMSSNQEEQTDTQMRIVLVEKFHQITGQISKAYKQSYVLSYRLSNLSQFIEMKTWEDITSKMVLKHKGQAYVMQMGNISVPMQEFINSSQIQTDQGPEIFVEYFIGKQNNQGEYLVTQSFEEISYPASLYYYIYLRFYHFNQAGIMHKKINLRELLNLFIADGYYKYQTNYMHSKLQLQDLVQLCDFVSYKLRTGTYGSILNQNQFQFKRTGLESYSRKTLQTLVKEQEQEEGENGIVEKFVFQPKPYSIVKVFIKKANRIVEFLIYTPSTSHTFKKKYTMSEISLSIPFVNLYLKVGLYRPLARNILKLLHKELSFHLKNFSKEKQKTNI